MLEEILKEKEEITVPVIMGFWWGLFGVVFLFLNGTKKSFYIEGKT